MATQADDKFGREPDSVREQVTQEDLENLPDLSDYIIQGAETIEGLMMENNRFCYKMRALQGEFAPPDGTVDSERGNTLTQVVMGFPGLFSGGVCVRACVRA